MIFIENTKKRLATYNLDFDALPANISLSDGNAKLKKSGIVSFNLIPIDHCPMAGVCKNYCYATVGQQAFRSGVIRRAAAFKATLSESFSTNMHLEVSRWKKKIQAIRIHDSGDFYSMDYLRAWLEVAKLNPDVRFYAYTKSLTLVHRAYDLDLVPQNMRLIQSVGGLLDHKIRKDLPHAKIFSTHAEMISAGYADASETDEAAAFGDSNKIGLVIHGQKKGKFAA